jgi:glycosyltransferase involved in cell wall biosynthesis
MKVAHLIGWYFPDAVGGSEVYVQELCRRQRASGLDVRVAAPRTSEDERYLWDGVDVFRFRIPAQPTRDEVQGRERTRGHEVFAQWLAQEQPDVLHVHSLVTGIGLDELAAAQRLGVRVVFTAHLPPLGFLCQRGTLLRWGAEPCNGVVRSEPCAACALEARGVPRLLGSAVAFAGRALGTKADGLQGRIGTALGMSSLVAWNVRRQQQLFALVDRFVVLNARARDIVLANGGLAEKVRINRLGVGFVPAARSRTRPVQAPVRVGFVGRLDRTKGADVLARALLALPGDASVRVELRGPCEDATLLQELHQAARRDARLSVGPAVARTDMPDALSGYDVLCCPSLWFENGPTVALEAQAVGTPVIGTPVGAMPEFIEDGVNGRLVTPGDWRALRDALADVAAHPHVIDTWRQRLPMPRTMDAVAAEYQILYRELRPVPAALAR